MRFPRARLLVFAKPPVPGTVKTRLAPVLGPAGCARLQRVLLDHTLDKAVSARLCPVELWCTDPAHPELRACAARHGASVHAQQGNDLGARMEHALCDALRRAPLAVLVGTDCPAATADDLGAAFAALAGGRDAVLGPAEDGGYYLVGARRSHPHLFQAMPWGTSRILERTRTRLRELGWSWAELPLRWDVDRPEDLERLATELDGFAGWNYLPAKGSTG